MTIANIICGIIGSILGAVIMAIVTKLYLGILGIRGFRSKIRLIRDSHKGGIVNFFPARNYYIRHKDHGTESQYICKSKKKIMYIGYWLANGIETGDVIQTLKKMILEHKDVEVILINPDNSGLIKEMADFLQLDFSEMHQRIESSLGKLLKMKNSLSDEFKTHFIIKLHDIPLNASAFMVDYDNKKELKILVDYKIYNQERVKSYGIEFVDGETAQALCESYREISRRAQTYK